MARCRLSKKLPSEAAISPVAFGRGGGRNFQQRPSSIELPPKIVALGAWEHFQTGSWNSRPRLSLSSFDVGQELLNLLAFRFQLLKQFSTFQCGQVLAIPQLIAGKHLEKIAVVRVA